MRLSLSRALREIPSWSQENNTGMTRKDLIVKAVLKGIDCSLFVDDFALCVSGKTLNRMERAIQLCVNSVQKWVSENGFKFSTFKTVCIHFHQQYGFSPDPNILLGKTPIKVVREAKFLGHCCL